MTNSLLVTTESSRKKYSIDAISAIILMMHGIDYVKHNDSTVFEIDTTDGYLFDIHSLISRAIR